MITRTDEVTVGAAAANACFGPAGIPDDVCLLNTLDYFFGFTQFGLSSQKIIKVALDSAEATVLRFVWTKPNCDESVAPIDGYEYQASTTPSVICFLSTQLKIPL
ncbi:unnamed protein product [Strongylus vulgaris]|uniref:Uncharacterized protein n=1 Tax=Strongylus vulgaris TaxID=40348 RepID=A0A3P7KMK3_STRVU|nr:unnamed protein product [Strongylus vulgaris]